jgi:low affinity Fe/Cu permease
MVFMIQNVQNRDHAATLANLNAQSLADVSDKKYVGCEHLSAKGLPEGVKLNAT